MVLNASVWYDLPVPPPLGREASSTDGSFGEPTSPSWSLSERTDAEAPVRASSMSADLVNERACANLLTSFSQISLGGSYFDLNR
mmetsp:Transcript_49677/g.94935  ORF Transcript_49677/g.94935 Transcript_49677/m.94935 type:complete len:85 (-) Transcript_49677:360-614(-)